jgi:hypothetical protein
LPRIPIKVVGGSYSHSVLPFDAQETINLYPEVQGPSSKSPGILLRFPGLNTFKTLTNGAGPIRPKGLYETSNHRLFCIRGASLLELSATATETLMGTLNSSFGPVSMIDNGVDLTIADGTNIYQMLLSTNVLTVVTDSEAPDTTPILDFVDGYIFAFDPASTDLGSFQHSMLKDASSWQTSDILLAEGSPDRVVSLIVNNQEVWVFGSKSYEIYYNTQQLTNTWQRIVLLLIL